MKGIIRIRLVLGMLVGAGFLTGPHYAQERAEQYFRVEVEPLSIPGLPGVQSFAWGKSTDGKVLIIGGRREGLHLARPFEAFDPAFNNTDLIVVDLKQQQVWTMPLSQSGLPTAIQEQFQSTNMQFVQVNGTLYITGGYGFSPTAGDHITFPYLTAVDVDSVVQAIIDGRPLTAYVRYIQDSRAQVTGGQMGYLDSFFYLCGGQVFTGRYNPMDGPTFTQQYVEEIRKFRILDDGVSLQIVDYRFWQDPQNLHRRDYNMVPQIFPDGTKGFTMFTGVFQHNADLPFLNSVNVYPDTYEVVNQNILLSHYHSAKFGVYDSMNRIMHTVFFGGIAQFYLDASNMLIRDDTVPFVRTISRVARYPDGTLREYKIGDMPALVGAGAEFVPDAPDSLVYPGFHEIFHLNRFPLGERIRVGYIIGGIESSRKNIFFINDGTLSWASPTVYGVYLTRDTVSMDIPVELTGIPESIRITLQPRVVNGTLILEAELPGSSPQILRIVQRDGKVVYQESLNGVVGRVRRQIDVHHLPAGVYWVQILGAQRKDRVSQSFIIP